MNEYDAREPFALKQSGLGLTFLALVFAVSSVSLALLLILFWTSRTSAIDGSAKCVCLLTEC